MKYPMEDFIVRRRLERQPERFPAAFVPQERVRQHVIVPRADGRSVSCKSQALLTCAQLLLNAHLRGEIDVLENYMRNVPLFIAHGKKVSLRPEDFSVARPRYS